MPCIHALSISLCGRSKITLAQERRWVYQLTFEPKICGQVGLAGKQRLDRLQSDRCTPVSDRCESFYRKDRAMRCGRRQNRQLRDGPSSSRRRDRRAFRATLPSWMSGERRRAASRSKGVTKFNGPSSAMTQTRYRNSLAHHNCTLQRCSIPFHPLRETSAKPYTLRLGALITLVSIPLAS